jgi:multisubunit Na+/H+ antiporter MnhC subunit
MPEAVFAEMGLPVKLVLLVVGLAVTVFLLSLIYKRRDKDIEWGFAK